MDEKTDTDSNKTKVLVVDDEEIIRHGLRLGLEKHGYQIVTAQKAKEALEEIKDEAFDVVLADIRMPEMDGIQMLKAIRQIDPELPVIFMTAYSNAQTTAEAIELGAENYITKPFHKVENVITVIEGAIAKARERKEGNPVVEGKGEKIECVDCHCLFFLSDWQPGVECPVCHSKDTFPLSPIPLSGVLGQGAAEVSESWRFGQIARWADLINSSQLVECLNIQWRLKKAGKPVPPLGEIMLEKGYLNTREVSALLEVQFIRRPSEEEKRFGKIALSKKFVTDDQLKRCLNIQARMMLYQRKAPHLGEILLEKGYMTESQIKGALKSQQKTVTD